MTRGAISARPYKAGLSPLEKAGVKGGAGESVGEGESSGERVENGKYDDVRIKDALNRASMQHPAGPFTDGLSDDDDEAAEDDR